MKRFIRTIKTGIWTYLLDRRTVRWVDVILVMVEAYNHSHHRSIGMAPADALNNHEDRIWVRLYGAGNTNLKPPISQRAMVWVSGNRLY